MQITVLRRQCDILFDLAAAAIKAANFDTDDATYGALMAGYCALQRELYHEERAAALLARSQAPADQPEAA